MSPRISHVYRLDITYPPRSHPSMPDWEPDWEPEGWGDEGRAQWAAYRKDIAAFTAAGGDPEDPFGSPMKPQAEEHPQWWGWPSARLYMSRSGAQGRAELFRKYGATVEIVRSKAVEW
jgi:hypothetical protein